MPTDQAQILARLEEIGRGWRERDSVILTGHQAGLSAYRMAKTLGMSATAVLAVIRKAKEAQS